MVSCKEDVQTAIKLAKRGYKGPEAQELDFEYGAVIHNQDVRVLIVLGSGDCI